MVETECDITNAFAAFRVASVAASSSLGDFLAAQARFLSAALGITDNLALEIRALASKGVVEYLVLLRVTCVDASSAEAEGTWTARDVFDLARMALPGVTLEPLSSPAAVAAALRLFPTPGG